jgi:hypothetical protein
MSPQPAGDNSPEQQPGFIPSWMPFGGVKSPSWLPHWFSLRALLIWILFFVLIYAGLIAWGYERDTPPSNQPMGEQVGPNEEYETTQVINSAIETSVQRRAQLIEASKNSGGNPPDGSGALAGFSVNTYTRDAHAKGHGCVLATFHVNREIEQRFQYGVFQEPGKAYQAIIRYSNGNPSIQPDSASDPRGMAVKLRDVPGDSLMPGEKDGHTQDFVMMNNPVFFIRTLEEYAQFNHLLTEVPNGTMPIVNAYFLQDTLNPLHWHLRELRLALGAGKAMPESLVTTRYWSASAYALGPKQFVKFSAIPCAQNRPLKVAGRGKDDPDYLRRELSRQSAQGGACFDFAVQPQVLGKNMPVEDTTVEWSESDSPFVPVARITIDQLDNTSADMYRQCENTSFNPWHSIPDHKPVGVMNRVRQALYAAMSRFRQDQNCKDSKNPCDARCNVMKWPDNGCTGAAASGIAPKPEEAGPQQAPAAKD